MNAAVPYTDAETRVRIWLKPGAANAIRISELRRLTSISPREIKEAVRGLRIRHRVPVGSSRGGHFPPGYYLIETAEEIERSFRTLLRNGIESIRAAHAVRKSARIEAALGQLDLEIGP